MSISSQGLNLLAFGVGGVVIAALGPKTGMLVDAISFAVSALSLAVVRMPRTHSSSGANSFVTDMIVGFKFLWNLPTIRAFVGFAAIVNLVGTPLAMVTPVYALDVLHGTASLYGFMQVACCAVGSSEV